MITFSKLGQYGRLGNQLWQIASTIGIARKNGTGFMFPDWDSARHFKNQLPHGKLDGPLKVHNEKSTHHYEVKLSNKFNWTLEGYFQSWKYFIDYEDEIRYYFDFETDHSIDAVAIHVRRTDYLEHQDVHPVLTLDYYRKALELFKDADTLFIFSDDISWCKRYLKGGIFDGRNKIFDVASPEIISFKQMTCCRHNIIANSSFSWWAAFLNKNPDKIVVSPKKWTNLQDDLITDRVFDNWVLI